MGIAEVAHAIYGFPGRVWEVVFAATVLADVAFTGTGHPRSGALMESCPQIEESQRDELRLVADDAQAGSVGLLDHVEGNQLVKRSPRDLSHLNLPVGVLCAK